MIARRLLLSLWYIVVLVMAVWLMVKIGEM